jgi:hypothetical protein
MRAGKFYVELGEGGSEFGNITVNTNDVSPSLFNMRISEHNNIDNIEYSIVPCHPEY